MLEDKSYHARIFDSQPGTCLTTKFELVKHKSGSRVSVWETLKVYRLTIGVKSLKIFQKFHRSKCVVYEVDAHN